MKAKISLTSLFAVGALAALWSPARADSVAVFYSGGGGYSLSIHSAGRERAMPLQVRAPLIAPPRRGARGETSFCPH